MVDTLKSNAVGSAIKNLASVKFLKYEVPFLLPPLQEQKRILKKIESLFKKNEEYNKYYMQSIQINSEFPEKLRKSILQYAMQGKLVPQDATDEPVEVLLKKIREEKQRLFEEGKLKKKDLQESIICTDTDAIDYDGLPEKWVLSSFKHVTNFYVGNSISAENKKKYFTGVDGVVYIATKDVDFDGTINYDNGIKIPNQHLVKFKISPSNSVLLCIEGGSAGRKIGFLSQNVCFGNKLCSLSFYVGENKFLYYYLQSPQFLNYFQDNKSGIIGGVNLKNLGNMAIPLMSQEEQVRIIRKVELLLEKTNLFNEIS